MSETCVIYKVSTLRINSRRFRKTPQVEEAAPACSDAETPQQQDLDLIQRFPDAEFAF